jgi:hypothetical protein
MVALVFLSQFQSSRVPEFQRSDFFSLSVRTGEGLSAPRLEGWKIGRLEKRRQDGW